jgi:hypothetical protein
MYIKKCLNTVAQCVINITLFTASYNMYMYMHLGSRKKNFMSKRKENEFSAKS